MVMAEEEEEEEEEEKERALLHRLLRIQANSTVFLAERGSELNEH
jgi:hypothetical protein